MSTRLCQSARQAWCSQTVYIEQRAIGKVLERASISSRLGQTQLQTAQAQAGVSAMRQEQMTRGKCPVGASEDCLLVLWWQHAAEGARVRQPQRKRGTERLQAAEAPRRRAAEHVDCNPSHSSI